MNPKDDHNETLGDVIAGSLRADLKEGTRISRYQILELLGKGGMGAVYKAYDPELDRSIAIKILTAIPHEGETASKPQTRLMREAQALAKLNHSHVVSIFDVGTFEDSVYIAMEYVKGNTLREWIEDEKPDQKSVIKVLSCAGRGLYAAHCEGIVHRDFKPDNVMVGDKGQIKVLDFGLARASEFAEPITGINPTMEVRQTSSREKLLSTPLTQIGATVGTTVYMAPEHFLGEKLDEKTDQFSFCVTLFEALYGRRPFPSKNQEELKRNTIKGTIAMPQEVDVPKWMEAIIVRGLSVSREERYESMAHLLEDLDHDPDIVKANRRKSLLLTTVILLLTSMTIGFGYHAIFKDTKVCTGAQKKITGIWSNQQRERIRQSFLRTGLAYADDSFIRVVKQIEEYLQKWKIEYTDTCQATRLRGEQSEEVMDLKMVCLHGHLKNAGALINVLSEADKTVTGKAIEAVLSLSGFSTCSDVEALRSRIPLPKDSQTHAKVIAIREKLMDIRALRSTGKYHDALKMLKRLQKEAMEAQYEPVQAEVLYQLGALLAGTGESEKAEAIFFETVHLAGESRNSFLVAETLIWLIRVIGYQQARHEEGLLLGRAVNGVLGLAGPEDALQSSFLYNLGSVYYSTCDYDKSLNYFLSALNIRRKSFGPQHPLVAQSLNAIGLVFWRQAAYEKAHEYLNQSLEMREKYFGSNHPSVASPLSNIGIVLMEQDENDKALDHFRRALRIWDSALGPNHPSVAMVLYNMGTAFRKKHDHDTALDKLNRALSIYEKELSPDHPELAEPLSRLARVYMDKGKPEEALILLERVVSLCDKSACDKDPYGRALFNLAQVLVAADGDKLRAIKLAEKALVTLGEVAYLKKKQQEVDAWLQKMQKS